jgi:hypothetical protein
MYTLTRIDNPFTGLIYRRFTFPQFRPHLEVLKAEGSTVAIAASDSFREKRMGEYMDSVEESRGSFKSLIEV